jgi:hypothetical protein
MTAELLNWLSQIVPVERWIMLVMGTLWLWAICDWNRTYKVMVRVTRERTLAERDFDLETLKVTVLGHDEMMHRVESEDEWQQRMD